MLKFIQQFSRHFLDVKTAAFHFWGGFVVTFLPSIWFF